MMKARPAYLASSIIISLSCLIVLLIVNWDIARTYASAYGKTRALFGIVLTARFGYRYLITIPVVFSGAIAIVGLKKAPSKLLVLVLLLDLIEIWMILGDSWRLML